MHTNRTPLRRRITGAVLGTIVVLTGGLMLASSASATFTNPSGCPETSFTPMGGGWVKYEPLHGTTYTYPQIPGYSVTQLCYKAAHEVRYPPVTPTITSTVTWWGHVQDLSHASVFYVPLTIPPKPADHVDVQTYGTPPSCEAPSVLIGTITTTIGHTWDPWHWQWVDSAPVVDDQTHVETLTAEQQIICVAGQKPDPVVDVQGFSGAPSCENQVIMVGEVVTTTDWVFDPESSSWVPGEPVVDDQRTELRLSEEEVLACETGPEPDPVVETVAFTGQPTCAAPTILVGEVTTTTGWVLDEETNTWVHDTPVVDDDRAQLSLSAAELAACVPTQPTQPTLPTARTASLALAETGSPALAPALTALGLVLMGATALLGRRRLHA